MKFKNLLLTLLFLSFSSARANGGQSNYQPYYNQFERLFEYVDKNYVEEPDKQKMVDAAIEGMLSALDPHSSYFADDDLDDFVNHTKGEFGGIGVEIMYDKGSIKVISPIEDLPAEKAGVKAGDYIIAVNDESVDKLGFNKAVKEMRGEPGTKVKIMVISELDTAPREVEITRALVKAKPVKSTLEPGNIAYIRITTFNKNTTDGLEKAITDLSAKEGGIKGIILDLRNNPGGLLDQAIKVTSVFIKDGNIVSTRGRNDFKQSILIKDDKVFAKNEEEGASDEQEMKIGLPKVKALDIPVIVLINSGSASASEIVAGALKDHKRALIIGTKSFGKGSVQVFNEIDARSGIKLTSYKYYTPSGNSIQGEGIEPDINIELLKVDYPKEKEKRFSEASLRNFLKNDNFKDSKSKEDAKANIKVDVKIDIKKDEKKEKKNASESEKKVDSKINNDGKEKKKEQTKEESTDLGQELPELYKKDYQFARAYDLIRALILARNN